MRRAALVSALFVLAAGAGPYLAAAEAAPARAAVEPSVRVEIEYTDRLLAMDDSAAAHVELARWCAANGLDERARVHWREALDRDPDNPDARAAAGFVRKDDRWVPASEAAPPGAPPRADADPDLAERTRTLALEVREIHRQYLIPTDAERWAAGRRRLLAIRDVAAAEPIARILGRDDVEVRMLACEALGQIHSDTSLRYLLGFLLADDSPSVYLQALEGLKRQPDDRIVQQLIYALARASQRARERAAFALGELRAEKAVPALISNLRAPEHRRILVKETVEPSHMIAGRLTAYVADLRPIVVGGAVVYKPVVGYVGATAGIGSSGPREVVSERDIIKMMNQPAVLDALKAITGMDFGFNIVEWRKWLARREAEKARQDAAAPK